MLTVMFKVCREDPWHLRLTTGDKKSYVSPCFVERNTYCSKFLYANTLCESGLPARATFKVMGSRQLLVVLTEELV